MVRYDSLFEEIGSRSQQLNKFKKRISKKVVDKQNDLRYPIKVASHERATQKKPARQERFERSEEHSQSYSDNQIEMQP